MSAWLSAIKILSLAASSPRHGISTLLIRSYDVPKSFDEESKITTTISISGFSSSSNSLSFLMISRVILSSFSTPSPSPGVSHIVRLSSSYLAIQSVSGSTPTPTLATSILNKAFIVELFPLPVAPVNMILTFLPRILSSLDSFFVFSASEISADIISSSSKSYMLFFSDSLLLLVSSTLSDITSEFSVVPSPSTLTFSVFVV